MTSDPKGDGVRFFGGYEVVEGEPAEVAAARDVAGQGEPGDDRCGVCGGAPAPWRHAAQTPAGAPLASAARWDLCATCHDLVLSAGVAALAERFVLEGLDPAQRLELAKRRR
ncbi:hypothetical protein [Nocardioides pacificus]